MAGTPSSHRVVASLGLSLLVLAASLSCGSADDEAATAPDNGYRPTIRTATTRRSISKEASDEFDRAIAAARTSTSVGTGPSSSVRVSSTSSSVASTSSTSSGGGLPSVPSGSAVTAEECKLFAQLINFVSSIEPLVDTADAVATAERVAQPVAQSKAGLDQLVVVAPSDIRVDVQTVITWLRAIAAADVTDHDAARGAMDDIQPWFDVRCGGART